MIITNKKKILPEIVISQKRSQFWHWELNYQADSVVIVSLPHSPVANGTDDYIDNMADAGRAVASALCSFDRTDSKKARTFDQLGPRIIIIITASWSIF